MGCAWWWKITHNTVSNEGNRSETTCHVEWNNHVTGSQWLITYSGLMTSIVRLEAEAVFTWPAIIPFLFTTSENSSTYQMIWFSNFTFDNHLIFSLFFNIVSFWRPFSFILYLYCFICVLILTLFIFNLFFNIAK